MRLVIALLIMLSVVGCTSNIKDVDFDKLEVTQVSKLKKKQTEDPFKSEVTPNFVKLIEKDDISIEVFKVLPIEHKGIKLDVWTVTAINNSDTNKCIAIQWKLQDFEFESDLPIMFILNSKQKLSIGKMKQTIWSFDEFQVAIPPSGYVENLFIREPSYDKKTHNQTCNQLETEIKEQ